MQRKVKKKNPLDRRIMGDHTVYVFTLYELQDLSDCVSLMRSALRGSDRYRKYMIALNKLKYFLDNECEE